MSARSEPALSRVAPTERTALEDSMGLSVTQLLALTDGTLVAGSAGAGRVVRQVVVDDPADPLAGPAPTSWWCSVPGCRRPTRRSAGP